MKAPDAATWWLPTGPVVVAGFEVVDDAWLDAVAAGADDTVVDDGEPVADELTDATVDDVVLDSWTAEFPSPPFPPLEQPTATSATVRSRTRSLTNAHHRASF